MDILQRSPKAQGWQPLGFVVLAIFALLLALPSQAFAQAQTDDVLREKVKTAIQRGQQFLLSKQNGNGSFETGYEGGYTVGANSLVGLALITSGMEPKEAAIQRCLRFVRLERLPEGTYDIGLAILFLSAVGEARDKPRIQQMAQTLIDHQVPSGGWGYGLDGLDAVRWDNKPGTDCGYPRIDDVLGATTPRTILEALDIPADALGYAEA